MGSEGLSRASTARASNGIVAKPRPDVRHAPRAASRGRGTGPLKILICFDSEIVLQLTGMALEAAGHHVVADREPARLVGESAGAAALLVDPLRGRQAAALLRDRGFIGKALLAAEGTPEELAKQAAELGVDGAV